MSNISEIQDIVEKNSISYTAIILNTTSKNKLLKLVEGLIPKGWEVIANHITINLGEAPAELKGYLDVTTRFNLTGFGVSEKAVAVSVNLLNDNIKSKNKIPHITIAVNRSIGGKPYDSNKIQKWYPFEKKIILSGRLVEIAFK
jgi:hypothetical protein